jgi:hypothetical protein
MEDNEQMMSEMDRAFSTHLANNTCIQIVIIVALSANISTVRPYVMLGVMFLKVAI